MTAVLNCEACENMNQLRVDVAKITVTVERIDQNVGRIEEQAVTRAEFKPVRLIAYGIVALMGTAFVGAVVAVVVR